MKLSAILSAALLAIVLVACAAPQSLQQQMPQPQKSHETGTCNLPTCAPTDPFEHSKLIHRGQSACMCLHLINKGTCTLNVAGGEISFFWPNSLSRTLQMKTS